MTNGMVYCRGCGKPIHSTAATCPHCGALQMIGAGKSKVVAGILAFLLGSLGIHRFYLGQWWGIFYLLSFWTFIPGVIAFIEGIIFLVTSDADWDRKYNRGVPSRSSPAALAIAIVAGALGFFFVVGMLAAIAIPQFVAYRRRAAVVQVRSDLSNAAVAQETFFAQNGRYKSCSSCAAQDLPGYEKNPKVTLNSEATDTHFTLTATHEGCRGGVWTYQGATRAITDPVEACK
jgi:TM2 domain-containing membrane protein YozV/Tfp pilus assembly protein PilE